MSCTSGSILGYVIIATTIIAVIVGCGLAIGFASRPDIIEEVDE